MGDVPKRVTLPLLEVLRELHESPTPLHGYEIKRRTKRSGPTVYNNLDRLDAAGWASSRWLHDLSGNPRRVYSLTDAGRAAAIELLSTPVGRRRKLKLLGLHLNPGSSTP
jgi:DNA-binding PadR family transcriptional regulator